VFDVFDKLLLLAPGGKTVFYGHRNRAAQHMAALGHACPPFFNAAEYVLSVIQRDSATLIDFWRASGHAVIDDEAHYHKHERDNYLASPSSQSPSSLLLSLPPVALSPPPIESGDTWSSSWSEQFWVLLKRSYQQKRGEIISRHQTARIMAVALIASLVWFQLPITARHSQDRFGALFFVVSFWYMAAMITATATFPLERRVIIRERCARSYRLSTYFMAKTLSELPVQMFYPTAFCLLYYWMIGFSATASGFLVFLASILLLVTCGESLGLLISNLVGGTLASRSFPPFTPSLFAPL
jgi:hypothetical protein